MKKNRIIILGSSGIISQNLQIKLKSKNLKFLVLGKKQINLKKKNSFKKLKNKISIDDVIVFISAEAPVRNLQMLQNNIDICTNFCKSIEKKIIKKIIYISSDAVYSDLDTKIDENSDTTPTSLHGAMHLMRETMLKVKFEKKLCILRPTLIYGQGDTHDGYGPNRFLKLAKKNKDIVLFGRGEEKRDHIYIKDLINILYECINGKNTGIFNVASGEVKSFYQIAKEIINKTKSRSKIFFSKRKGKMPHNGYRPFNIKLIRLKFKKIKINSIHKGLQKYISDF